MHKLSFFLYQINIIIYIKNLPEHFSYFFVKISDSVIALCINIYFFYYL